MTIENASRIPVDSSNIESVAHDEASKVMRVWFKNGAVYDYVDVPRATYIGLISASSVGKYFHAHVRNSFEYTRSA